MTRICVSPLFVSIEIELARDEDLEVARHRGRHAKRTSLPPAILFSLSTGMLETAIKFSGTTAVS